MNKADTGTQVTTLVLDEQCTLPLDDFCTASGMVDTVILEMVYEGILEPEGDEPTAWRFSSMCLSRARCALRLRHDLGLDWHGIAFALPLLEELQELRRRHRILLRRLGS